MTNAILLGKTDAGNLHVRFCERDDRIKEARPLRYTNKIMRVALIIAMMTCGFAVRSEVELPLGYTSLEWIASTSRQELDTGIGAHSGLEAEMDLMLPDNAGVCVLGCCKSKVTTTERFYMLILDSANKKAGYGYNTLNNKNWTYQPNQRYTVRSVLKKGEQYLEIDGVKYGNTTDNSDVAPGATLRLFSSFDSGGSGGSSNWSNVRLYECKIYEGGAPLRHFVPCRTKLGEAGLWDKVEGKFYGNIGTGRFRGSDGDDDMSVGHVAYIESTGQAGKQYVNTLYNHTGGDKVVCDVNISTANQSVFSCLFGALWGNSVDGYTIQVSNNGATSQYLKYFRDDTSVVLGNSTALRGKRITITCEGKKATWNDGTTSGSGTLTSASKDSQIPMLIFNQNYATTAGGVKMSDNWWTAAKLYRFDIISSNGTPQRKLVPWRKADGTVSLYDHVTKQFYPNSGTGAAFGYAEGPTCYYTVNDDCSVLELRKGIVDDAEILGLYSTIEKVGPFLVDATAATSFPALTLTAGSFSVQDEQAQSYTVDGTLTLKGGAKFAIDLTAEGCDSLVPNAVVFDGATQENPVLIDVARMPNATNLNSLPVVAQGIPGGDVEEVTFVKAVSGSLDAPYAFKIVNGALLMSYSDPTAVTMATWRGGVSPDVANPENWDCRNFRDEVLTGQIPTADTSVILPDGGVFNFTNGAPFVCKTLVLPATLGGSSDLRGVSSPMTGTVDLKGNRLYLSSANGSFAVTNSSVKYQRLAWIQSTGRQELDTGIGAHSGLEAEIDLQLPDSAGVCVLGCCKSKVTTTERFYMLILDSANKKAGYGYNTLNNKYWTYQPNQRYTVRSVLKKGEQYLEIDGVKYGNTTDNSDVAPGATLRLFASFDSRGSGGSANWSNVRLYECKICEGGVILRHFVPCRTELGEAGLWDKVEGKFYGNIGSGDFLAGPVEPMENTGELHLDVPEGKTLETENIEICGFVKVVKDGAGTLVANRPNQTYGSGTVVAEGTMAVPLSGETGKTYSFDNRFIGISGTPVTIDAGATFDTKGNYGLETYDVVLNGGTLANTGCKQANYTSWACGGNLTLTANSQYEINYTTAHTAGQIDLGGFELDLNLNGGNLLLNQSVMNGTLKTSGTGFIQFRTTAAKDMRTVDLVLGTAISVVDVDISVRNLTTKDYTGDVGYGGSSVKVFGTYKPINDYVYNFVLQDGSTLDLSTRTMSFDMTGKSLTFAGGATITIDLGARRDAGEKGKIVSWTVVPKNNVNFKLKDGILGQLEVKSDGLYLKRGMCVILR